jgi:RepB DNA-primase from phage plasmid
MSERLASIITVAENMLTAFESAGVERYDRSLVNELREGEEFRPNLTAKGLRRSLPGTLRRCEQERLNFIIRPRGCRDYRLIQLDDLDQGKAAKAQGYGFMVVETSPANYQVWLAVEGGDSETARRLKRGIGADMGASGAVKLAGSLNFKPQYAPNYPRVRLVWTDAETPIVRLEVLEESGLLAPKASATEIPAIALAGPPPNAWPDYQRCLQNAPLSRDGEHVDCSRADYTWAKIALQRFRWIQRPEAAIPKLYALSAKAQEKGEVEGMAYCRMTVNNALLAVVEEAQAKKGAGK